VSERVAHEAKSSVLVVRAPWRFTVRRLAGRGCGRARHRPRARPRRRGAVSISLALARVPLAPVELVKTLRRTTESEPR